MSIIVVRNLVKKYEYYKKNPGLAASVKSLFKREKLYAEAVNDISFSIEEGELVGFLGPNGAGKTTTLKVLSGILHPTSGEARVLGHVPWKREKAYQMQFALVMGQKNQLWWDLPAMESFILNKEIYEVPDKQFEATLEELTDLLGVAEILDVQVRKLSLGQRMKCELIAALLHRPKVLFLDEPTIGLDVVAQKNIRDFIKKYNRTNRTTILLTSHYMEDIKELAKRVIIIDKGRIIYDGDLGSLILAYSPYKQLTITLEGEGAGRAEIERFGEVIRYETHSATLRVPRDQAKAAASEILSSGLPVDDILIDETGVDEVVRQIFKESRS